MVADFGDHLIPATEQPVEHLGRAKAPVEAQDNLRPPFPRPPEAAFHLLERAFECWDSGCFPAEQHFMEDFSVGTRCDPERFTPRLTPITSHPGALTALGSGPNRQRGEIDIH